MIMHDKGRGPILILGLALVVILYGGVQETAFSHTSVRETTQNVKSDQRLSLKVPQGEGLVFEEEKEQPHPGKEKKSLPETPDSKAEPRRKGRPPKKFVPSEKIPADQAVDFPADI
jgi:hypothetical protein